MPCNVRQGCHSDLSPLSNAIGRTWQGEIGSQNSLREQGPSVTFILLKHAEQVQKCEPWSTQRIIALSLTCCLEADSWGGEKEDSLTNEDFSRSMAPVGTMGQINHQLESNYPVVPWLSCVWRGLWIFCQVFHGCYWMTLGLGSVEWRELSFPHVE